MSYFGSILEYYAAAVVDPLLSALLFTSRLHSHAVFLTRRAYFPVYVGQVSKTCKPLYAYNRGFTAFAKYSGSFAT